MSEWHEGVLKDLTQRERRFIQDAPKYFMHGLLYAILGTLATFVFAFISIVSTLVVGVVAQAGGELIGYVVLALFFIVLLFLIFFVAGLINAMLSRSFWRANPPGGFKSYVGHGVALIFILVIFGIPNIAIDIFFPNLDFAVFIILAIPRIIVYAIIDGFLGRWIAYGFSDFPVATKSVASDGGITGTCPQCGVDTLVLIRHDIESKVAVCHGCGNPFDIPWPKE